MNTSTRMTPRQAAYRDLFAIIAQLSGRSRRAQRTLLEAELVRALERAYEFQLRCAQLGVLVASQKDKLLSADIEVTVAQGTARQRVHGVRQEVFAVIERCRAFEEVCREFVALTQEAVVVEPPPLVVTPRAGAPQDDADGEAVTERCPKPSVGTTTDEP
jgi:hypothetical protein